MDDQEKTERNMTREMFWVKLFASGLMAAVCTVAAAQEPDADRDLDRQVDVSREYMPDMDRAAKLTIQPLMSDTVSLRPELEYTVSPAPWYTGFGVAAINPVRIDAARFEQLLPFYMKAGFGIPSRSVVDIYGTTTSTGGGYAGGYLNHQGRWSKLRNDGGLKERALESDNSVGIFGRAALGRRVGLSAEIGYDYDIRSRYGFLAHADPADPRKSELVSYSVPRAAIGIGHDFTDLTSFNFAVGAEGYLLRDRQQAKETGVKFSLALGKRFNVHELMLGASYDGAFGSDALDGNDITFFAVKPSYGIRGGKVRVGAAVEIAYSKMKDRDSKTLFMPSAQLELLLADAFMPFVKLDSRTVSNSYRSITSRNPYIAGSYGTAPFVHPARDYAALAGIRGDVSSAFSYEVRVGGGMIKDVQYFIYETGSTGSFMPASEKKLKYLTAGAGLTGRISESFNAGLEVDFYNYSSKELDKAPDMPQFRGDLFLRYNWRQRVFVKLRGDLTGTRYFGEAAAPLTGGDGLPDWDNVTLTKQKGVFDLGLEAEYRLTPNLVVWLAGDNLLNGKLYPYYRYRGFGISVTAGVKILF